MRYGVLGTGMVGQTLATRLAELGHEVIVSPKSRGLDRYSSAIASRRGIELSTPASNHRDPIRSPHCEQLGAIDGVAGEAEVSDASDAVAAPTQENEICRCSFVASLEYEECRAAVHGASNDPPIRVQGVAVEVFGHLAAALSLQPIHEVQPNIVSQHVAYGIEVSRVEARRILEEARAFGRRQRGWWDGIGLARQFAQARASSLQRRLEDASSRDLANLRERIAEHIDENDRATLYRREVHKASQARVRRECVPARIRRIGDHLQGLVIGKGGRVTRAPAEEIQRRVVCDTE